DQGMGGGVSKSARLGGAIVRAGAGNAGAGAPDGAEHQRSGTAGRLSGAAPECRCGPKAGGYRRTERRENPRDGSETDHAPTRDRAEPAKMAERRGIAVF